MSPFYDPLLAKVIARGASREEARRRLIAALEDTIVFGLKTNRSFLAATLGHPAFVAGEATTGFIARHFAAESAAMRQPAPDLRILALAAVLLFEARVRETSSPSGLARNWSSTGIAIWPLRLTVDSVHHPASIMAVGADCYSVVLGQENIELTIERRDQGAVRFTAFGLQQTARFAVHDRTLYLDLDGMTATVRDTALEAASTARREGSARLLAPMNGAIISVQAKSGDRVAKGQCVVVLEAMKMQHEIAAERDGVIDKVLVKPGDQVATRQLLVELKAEAGLREATA